MDDPIRTLYADCAPDLFRIAWYRLRDEALAQDVVQEVFVLLLEKEAALKDHPNLRGWLVKTLHYRILHAVDQRLRECPLVDEALLPAQGEGNSLDEILPAQLSPEDKQILKLFYEEGRSYEELSTLLGVPPNTCGTWLYRARMRCKHYLLKEAGKDA